MEIRNLSLYNYRNFATVDQIEFPSQALLVAAAPNATGKTNFLESVYVLLRGKSWRVATEECVRWGEDSFIVRGTVDRAGGEGVIGVRYHKPSRRLRIEENGVPASPVTFFSHYPFEIFLPEDSFLFSRGPAQRRNFMNRVLVSSPVYVSALVQFQRALKQRNALLKTAKSFSDILGWTQLLVEQAVVVWQQRKALVDYINTNIAEWYEKVSGESKKFNVQLEGALPDKDEYMKLLEEMFGLEKRYGYTINGPHRDDLVVKSEKRLLATAFSQGQGRSAVIAVKLAAHKFMENVTKEKPLLLLDEVLSELDEKRQDFLLKNLPEAQILLTCTAVPNILRQRSNVHLLDLGLIVRQDEKENQSGKTNSEGGEAEKENGEEEPAESKEPVLLVGNVVEEKIG
ncbi:MAG: DNA replication and repair protein RecF [Candidatus Andersenbacteria bacterium]|nr:DNA replication and repair protein RecF [bacterium]MDZ4225644.1 DNA replication and repair protein RecF [Candidatus Andersenbacteria bacterium]